MTTQPAIRQRLHDYINIMPDYGLSIVEPILAHFADKPFFVDTNLTEDEKEIIKAGRIERKEHPENFTSWAAIKPE